VEPLGRSLSIFFTSPNFRDHDDPNYHNIVCVCFWLLLPPSEVWFTEERFLAWSMKSREWI
jgi:hypothetical protein